MLLLSFLVQVLFIVLLLMSFHTIVETRSLVIIVLPYQSYFYLLLTFSSLGGKGCLPLLVGPTNKEDLGLFILKVPPTVADVYYVACKPITLSYCIKMNFYSISFLCDVYNEAHEYMQ